MILFHFIYYCSLWLNFLVEITGNVDALGWWDLFINYGYLLAFRSCFLFTSSHGTAKTKCYVLLSLYRIAECFAFLVCTKWSNPMIHRNSQVRETSSSSNAARYLDWNSGLMVTSENHTPDRLCCFQDIGGHIMKIPIIGFQLLLCMRLEVVNDLRIQRVNLHSQDFFHISCCCLWIFSGYTSWCQAYPSFHSFHSHFRAASCWCLVHRNQIGWENCSFVAKWRWNGKIFFFLFNNSRLL